MMGGKSASFRQQVAKPKKLGPEYNPWFWNPNRVGVRKAPTWFMEMMKTLDGWEDLDVTWNPIQERWQVWARMPRLEYPICQGWRLLFVHHDAGGNYMPLDERLLARLYWSSAAAYGDAKRYFDRMQSEMQRDKERQETRDLEDTTRRAQDYLDYTKVKNIGAGDKFTRFM